MLLYLHHRNSRPTRLFHISFVWGEKRLETIATLIENILQSTTLNVYVIGSGVQKCTSIIGWNSFWRIIIISIYVPSFLPENLWIIRNWRDAYRVRSYDGSTFIRCINIYKMHSIFNLTSKWWERVVYAVVAKKSEFLFHLGNISNEWKTLASEAYTTLSHHFQPS